MIEISGTPTTNCCKRYFKNIKIRAIVGMNLVVSIGVLLGVLLTQAMMPTAQAYIWLWLLVPVFLTLSLMMLQMPANFIYSVPQLVLILDDGSVHAEAKWSSICFHKSKISKCIELDDCYILRPNHFFQGILVLDKQLIADADEQRLQTFIQEIHSKKGAETSNLSSAPNVLTLQSKTTTLFKHCAGEEMRNFLLHNPRVIALISSLLGVPLLHYAFIPFIGQWANLLTLIFLLIFLINTITIIVLAKQGVCTWILPDGKVVHHFLASNHIYQPCDIKKVVDCGEWYHIVLTDACGANCPVICEKTAMSAEQDAHFQAIFSAMIKQRKPK